jgi:hypothetical protein
MRTVNRVFIAALLGLSLAACGSTATSSTPVTPAVPPFGVAPGSMQVAVRVAGPLNFSKYRYQIVFNTTGDGLTPNTNTFVVAYSYALEISSTGKTPGVQPYEFLRSSGDPTGIPAYVPLLTSPGDVSLVANSNGTSKEFTVTFRRSVFGGAGSAVTSTWLFNVFTSAKNGAAVDTMGKCATCFVSPKLPVDDAFAVQSGAGHTPGTSDLAAKLVSVRIVNAP